VQLPDELDPAGFLAEFWQKKPLFVRAGVDAPLPQLSPDELAWLATLPDVESRLVFTERRQGKTTYRVDHGPFDDSVLAALPDRDWTLLVQDIDKHLPEFRRWFDLVPFVPDWRIDDLMISFAAPGGSVGPHVDNYDVFLCQAAGQREWRLTRADSVSESGANGELALLNEFAADQSWIAQEHDILYLPPGVPHWGIAVDRCMTFSIGMRAPEWPEFASASERLFPTRKIADQEAIGRSLFYRDPDLQADEASPGLISRRALLRARDWVAACHPDDEQIAAILGSVVTDPKAWLSPEHPGMAESHDIARDSGKRAELALHGMAKIAFARTDNGSRGGGFLFVNGFHHSADAVQIDQIERLCRSRRLTADDLAQWRAKPALQDLLAWLLSHGAFDLGTE